MRVKLGYLALGVVALGLLAAACGAAPAPTPTAAAAPTATQPPAPEPVKVCGSIPLTGRFAEPGNATREGFELWADAVNQQGGLLGRPVELILRDNASDEDQAVSGLEQLITEEGCQLLLGPFSSALTFPTSAVAARHNMLFISPAGATERIYTQGFKNVYNCSPSPARQSRVAFDFLLSLPEGDRPETIALINDDDLFANFVAEGAEAAADELGLEIVYRQTFPAEGIDYTPIAQGVRDSAAQAVIFGTAGAQSAIGFMQAAAQLDLRTAFVFESSGPDQREFKDALGDLAEAVTSSIGFNARADWEGVAGFVQAFQAEFGREPLEDNATGYCVGQLLQMAVEATGTFDNQALIDWMNDQAEKEVPTVMGPLTWDERGFPLQNSLLHQWQGEQLELIWPPEVATSAAVYPKPW